MKRSKARWWTAGVGAAAVAALGVAVPGQAAVGHPAATSRGTVHLKAGSAGKSAVTRTGTVTITKLATSGAAQKLTAAQQHAVNRPLKTAAQLAAYQAWAKSHPGSLAKATPRAAPSKPRNFIAGNNPIPQLTMAGNGSSFSESGCGCTPPDQAVGTSSKGVVYEGVNNVLHVYNGSLGTLYGPIQAQTFFAPLYHSGDFFSDPQITYDVQKSRWLISWLEINGSGTGDYIDFAVSKGTSPNPTTFFEYQVPANVSGSSDFCDYDTLGYESQALWVGCTTFDGNTGGFLGNRVFGFPLTQVTNGTLSNFVWFYNIPTDVSCGSGCVFGAYRLSPAMEDGTPQGEYISATDAGFGVVSQTMTVCALTGTAVIAHGGIPAGTCLYTTQPLAYDDPFDAPQPGTSAGIYPGFGTKQLAYRAGQLWWAMPIAINCGGTVEDGLWWGSLTPQLTALTSGYPQAINGSATTQNAYWCYSGGISSYLPTISPGTEGDAALVFNISAASTYYPSIVFTGRQASDAPGTMGSDGVSEFAVGGSAPNTTGRFGDYSACALAQSAATRGTWWCAGEYGGTDVWNTALYQLRGE